MTNIMLSTDELMTLFTALKRATEAAAEAAKAQGKNPESSRDYTRNRDLLEKVKQVMK
jgi:hypothetical protein